MLIPVPGYGHLKIHVPDPPRPAPANTPTRAGAHTPSLRLRAQVLVFLEVLCSRRPLRQLAAGSFAAPVLAYARAHRRAQQPVRLRSLHQRGGPGGEIYGSCEIGGTRHGFTGCVRHGKIVELRVLW